jgi:hypothetical protein
MTGKKVGLQVTVAWWLQRQVDRSYLAAAVHYGLRKRGPTVSKQFRIKLAIGWAKPMEQNQFWFPIRPNSTSGWSTIPILNSIPASKWGVKGSCNSSLLSISTYVIYSFKISPIFSGASTTYVDIFCNVNSCRMVRINWTAWHSISVVFQFLCSIFPTIQMTLKWELYKQNYQRKISICTPSVIDPTLSRFACI